MNDFCKHFIFKHWKKFFYFQNNYIYVRNTNEKDGLGIGFNVRHKIYKSGNNLFFSGKFYMYFIMILKYMYN